MESNEVGVRSGQMRSFVWSLSVIHDSALTLIIIIIYLSFFFFLQGSFPLRQE